MWWKLTLAVIAGMLVFFVVGLYLGGGAFLLLTRVPIDTVSISTLFEASRQPLSSRGVAFLPWAWCVTVAVTFLPLGLTLLAFILVGKPKESLHGNARFANESELRSFYYHGDYK